MKNHSPARKRSYPTPIVISIGGLGGDKKVNIMTKKQRLKVYKEAYHLMEEHNWYMCILLKKVIRYELPEYSMAASGDGVFEVLEEFSLFKPRHIKEFGSWFGEYDRESQQKRLTILAFCIAMCED